MKSNQEDAIKAIKDVQKKCPHHDISNWTPIGNKIMIRFCLDCNKEVERMEIK